MKRIPLLIALGLLLMGCVLLLPPASLRPGGTPTSIPMGVGTPTPIGVGTPTVVPTPTSSADAGSSPEAGSPGSGAPSNPSSIDLSLYRQAMLPGFADEVDAFADATRYQIDLGVDLDSLTLSGEQQVRYTNLEDEPLGEIVFRLLPNTPGYGGSLQVSALAVNGAPATPEWRLGRSVLYVPLASPLAPGETVEIGLTFSGTIPTDPSSGYAQYGYYDGVLALPNVYPMIPVYDDEGWNVELAASYGDAAFTDTALYVMRVTLPDDVLPVTSGAIVERRENGDGTATHTAASGPMRDFSLVASADYEMVSERVGQVQVTSYYRAGAQAGGQRGLDVAVESLRVYERLFGAYPFSELDVVATPTRAGGIEYPGLIVVAEELYDQEGGFFELATAHEVAHQWWYSLVGNDQLDEPWLDESLTQYVTLLYFEQRYGQEVAKRVLESVFEQPYAVLQEQRLDMAIGLPVAAYSEGLYGAVVYGKGPLFFHALRGQVGDEAFTAVLRTYYERYRYGVAYPADLLAVAEEVSGQELDALYEEWVVGNSGSGSGG